MATLSTKMFSRLPYFCEACFFKRVPTRVFSLETKVKEVSESLNVPVPSGVTLLPYTPPELEAWVSEFTSGKRLAIAKLNNSVFGERPRLDILHRVVVWQLAKRRAGTAKTKDRSEVRGGGKKPWKQKGTGKARQGSIRAPQWRGGGVVHGPTPKSYDYSLPKKVRRLGLRTALSIKYNQGDLELVDSFELPTIRTKVIQSILKDRNWKSVLFVDGGEVNMNFALSTRNVPNCEVLSSIGLNVYSILHKEKLVLTLGALRMLEERL